MERRVVQFLMIGAMVLFACCSSEVPNQNLSIQVDASENILFDVFPQDPFYLTYDVDLRIIDEDTGRLISKRHLFDGSNQFSLDLAPYRRVGLYMEADGFYYGNLFLTDVMVTEYDEPVAVSFGRDAYDRVTVLVNGFEVAVFFDCGCPIFIG